MEGARFLPAESCKSAGRNLTIIKIQSLKCQTLRRRDRMKGQPMELGAIH